MRSMTGFESTKKPPLMKPSLAGSFSRKAVMRSAFSCTEPKRAGGRTMVMVARLPWRLWKAMAAAMSTSLRPSP